MIPIYWTEKASIPNLTDMLAQYERYGGSIVEYERIWSVIFFCHSGPVFEWLPPGRSRRLVGCKHALFCMAFGWWSRAGLLGTLGCIVNNLFGGVDVTAVLTAKPLPAQPPPLPGKPPPLPGAAPVEPELDFDPAVLAELASNRRRSGIVTLVSLALVIGLLIYTGIHFIGDRKATRRASTPAMTAEVEEVRPDPALLQPRIKTTAFRNAVARISSASDSSPMTDALVGDLIVAYGFETESTFRMAMLRDLPELGLPRSEVQPRAIRNLERRLGSVGTEGAPPVSSPKVESDFRACMLLVDSFWEGIATKETGDIVVAVPHRDILLITRSSSPEGLAKLRATVAEVFRNQSTHNLTRHLLVRRAGKWEVFE